MTPLIEKLDKRLLGQNPLDYVKMTKRDWAELRPLIEDGLRFSAFRDAVASDDQAFVDALIGESLRVSGGKQVQHTAEEFNQCVDAARKQESGNAS